MLLMCIGWPAMLAWGSRSLIQIIAESIMIALLVVGLVLLVLIKHGVTRAQRDSRAVLDKDW
jgi:hypothetical protein